MSVLTEQCRAGKCIDVSSDARCCGITQRAFVSSALWESYIMFDPDSDPKGIRRDTDPRLMMLLWRVRGAMPLFPEHRPHPVTCETEVDIKVGDRVIETHPVIVTIAGDELIIDRRLAG